MMVSFISANFNTVRSYVDVPWHEVRGLHVGIHVNCMFCPNGHAKCSIYFSARFFRSLSHLEWPSPDYLYDIINLWPMVTAEWHIFLHPHHRSVGGAFVVCFFFCRIYHWIVKWLKRAARPNNNRAFHFRALGSFALIITNDVCHTRSTPNTSRFTCGHFFYFTMSHNSLQWAWTCINCAHVTLLAYVK